MTTALCKAQVPLENFFIVVYYKYHSTVERYQEGSFKNIVGFITY